MYFIKEKRMKFHYIQSVRKKRNLKYVEVTRQMISHFTGCDEYETNTFTSVRNN